MNISSNVVSTLQKLIIFNFTSSHAMIILNKVLSDTKILNHKNTLTTIYLHFNISTLPSKTIFFK